MNSTTFLGYSERGIFNSIVFYLSEHTEKITQFLEVLGINNKTYDDASKYTFLLEPSFSDFGTCDLVIIIENQQNKNKTVIFIEGKVKTMQGYFSLEKEFKKLNNCKEKFKGISSNIFVQLYYKYLLTKVLQKGESNTGFLNIKDIFKKNRNSNRYIGKNEIVKRTIEKYIKFASNYYYVAIIPEVKFSTEDFQEKFIKSLELFEDEDIANIKCANWKDIEEIFADNNIVANIVAEHFVHNKGQIY